MSESKALVFRINDNGQGPDLLKQTFLERGWVEFDERNPDESDWNIWWKGARFRTCDHDQIQSWQRLNHFPNSTGITKKDCLARNFRRMKAVYGSAVYNFCPETFNLPNDYKRFVAEYSKYKENDNSRNLLWICKPADMSRGRGIFIFRDLAELQYDCSAVVQRYIPNPLLIGGYKFDIRIYVTVPSFHPLKIYIYQEGLVRFGTEKYDLTSLDNIFSHLTNTSINKYSPFYTVDKERIGHGCKWTLTQLRQYFRQINLDDEALFNKIVNIIILTILIQAPLVPHASNCFEMYGFDILIDEKLKPFLLEVNFSPALSSDCQTDIIVKKPLLHDLLDMMKFSKRDLNRKDGSQKNSAYRTNHKFFSEHQTHNSSSRKSVHKFPSINTFSKVKPSISKTECEDSDSDLDTDIDSMWNNREDSICYGLPLVNPTEIDEDYNNEDSPDSTLLSAEKENVLPASIQKYSSSKRLTSIPNTSNKCVLSERNNRSSLSKLPYIERFSKMACISYDSGYSGSSDNSDGISWSEDNISLESQRPSHSVDKLISSGVKRSIIMSHSQTQKSKPVSFNSQKVGRHSSSSTMLSLDAQDRNMEFFYGEAGTTARSVTNLSSQQHSMKRQTSQLSSRSVHIKRPSTSHTLLKKSSKVQKKRVSYKSNILKPSFSVGWKTPETRIGDFFLVFPFNDTTRKFSTSSLDVKAIIQEIQKHSKQATANANLHKDTYYKTKDKFPHLITGQDTIWRPLKPMEVS